MSGVYLKLSWPCACRRRERAHTFLEGLRPLLRQRGDGLPAGRVPSDMPIRATCWQRLVQKAPLQACCCCERWLRDQHCCNHHLRLQSSCLTSEAGMVTDGLRFTDVAAEACGVKSLAQGHAGLVIGKWHPGSAKESCALPRRASCCRDKRLASPQ